MKFKISIALNIVFLLIILFLAWNGINDAISNFYSNLRVSNLAGEAVTALDAGKTKLVHDVLSGIATANPNYDTLNDAIKKLHDGNSH